MRNGRSRIIPFLLVFCMVFFAFFTRAQGETPGSRRIMDIRVKGNYAVSTATVLNKLKIKPGDIFEESILDKELKRLYAMGYFSDVFIETEESAAGVVVIFAVIEKPVITAVEFHGNARMKSARLQKTVSVKEGDLVDFNRLSQDVSEISAFYTEEGYYRVSVDYQIEPDETGRKAAVVFVIDEGHPLRVKSIEVEGNDNVPDNKIKKLMSIRPAWWFIQKGAFDEGKFQADLSRIATYYRSKGYLDARVSSREEYSDDGQDMNITVVIDEGKKYMVGDIAVRGELAFPEKAVRELILMKSGDSFDYEMMKADVEDVRMFYYDRGYMNVEVDLQHRYNPGTDSMDLTYDILSHDEINVGKINIIGNTKTRDKVVRRQIRVYPGEKYDGKKLKRSKERIYNLGYFEDVYFETVPTGQKDVKDLNVTVKETKTGEFSFGGGYSSVDSFIGFVQVQQKNFDILDFPTFTGAGQNLTIRAELGSARTNYFLSWTDPWIFDYPLLFGFDVYREEHNRYGRSGYGYDERRTGGSLRLGKELTEYLNTGLIYNLEEVRISQIPDNATDALRREVGENVVSRLTWNLDYDKRDNRYSPSKGYFAGLSLQNAGGFLGGDRDFVKGWVHASYYHSIIKKVVLEVKGAVGLSEPYGDTDEIPIYERFFSGGGSTIRGYEERAVGPRDPGSNDALGGEALVLGNVEITFPLFANMIKGAVFYDVGNVWAESKDLFQSGYKHGTGIGVRVKTPIGPVKLDYGYPLSDNYDDKKEGQFYFSVSHGF
ncbi:MAG: outer membrane protein assembly factor BamA [Candidatus Omnitrophica bacterium]|nr:outer membrane protein assembly factor BamA [Candidatus Omnitrophota bacterium]